MSVDPDHICPSNPLGKAAVPEADLPRIRREKRTMVAMFRLYCRAHHRPKTPLCDDCRALVEYATVRLDRCPFGSAKPACQSCPIHCYKPAMRAAVKEVMRYSGPRMLLRHPILAILHQWDILFWKPPER